MSTVQMFKSVVSNVRPGRRAFWRTHHSLCEVNVRLQKYLVLVINSLSNDNSRGIALTTSKYFMKPAPRYLPKALSTRGPDVYARKSYLSTALRCGRSICHYAVTTDDEGLGWGQIASIEWPGLTAHGTLSVDDILFTTRPRSHQQVTSHVYIP